MKQRAAQDRMWLRAELFRTGSVATPGSCVCKGQCLELFQTPPLAPRANREGGGLDFHKKPLGGAVMMWNPGLVGRFKGKTFAAPLAKGIMCAREPERIRACVCARARLCPALCDPTVCSPPCSSGCGIFPQEYWSELSFSPPGGSSWPRDGTCVSRLLPWQANSLTLSHLEVTKGTILVSRP